MAKMSALSYINHAFNELETHFKKKVDNSDFGELALNNDITYIAFVSIGNPSIRARVFKHASTDIHSLFDKLQQKAIQLVRKKVLDPTWLKVDIVTDVKKVEFSTLEKIVGHTRKNYFRYGIAFDTEFRLAFLEQEINGNAMIRSVKQGPTELNEKNINHYLQYNYNRQRLPFRKGTYKNKSVFLFKTVSAFISKEDRKVICLYNGERSNGIRKIEDTKAEVKSLIEKATDFLVHQLHPNGKFEYGYFSAFAKRIDTYNILRHSSTLYSMAEGYEVIQDKRIIRAVEKGIHFLIREAIVYKNSETAYVVDHANKKEIKLGSNATAILAITKYTEVTGDETFIHVAQALAKGIIDMKTPSGGFIHVLEYPTYEIKEMHRIIYYEGEAIFALLRLYAMDKKEKWLKEVKQSFEYFINNDYWKHHDHWLSYAANEITLYEPEDKYFIFGLKNCQDRLTFIYHRETTYPTFLELTMATYKMVDKIKKLNKTYLLKYIDEAFLEATIDHRAEYQRVGFFYPELAMYKKEPKCILNGFFIRHHSFRVRIDDVEHYLSGYCQYLQHRIPKLPEPYSVSLIGN